MRVLAALVAVVAGALGFAGCGGNGGSSFHCLAGDVHCGLILIDFHLSTDYSPATPIPVGSSVTVTIRETRCVGSGSQSGPPPGLQQGCGVPFVPPALAASVNRMNGPGVGPPCPATAVVSGPGAITVSRTGPGDPQQQWITTGVTGWCIVSVEDPVSASNFGAHPGMIFAF